jgi:hypothetical protein
MATTFTRKKYSSPNRVRRHSSEIEYDMVNTGGSTGAAFKVPVGTRALSVRFSDFSAQASVPIAAISGADRRTVTVTCAANLSAKVWVTVQGR